MVREFVDDDEESVEKIQGLHSAHFADFQGHPLTVEKLIAALLDGVHAVWFATSAKDGELERRTNELEAEGGIQGVVNSGAVEHGKPASDTFEEASRRAEASTAETVAVRDAIWDVESAKEVGIRTVAVLFGGAFDGETRREAGAAEVQKDCAALPEAGFPG